MPKTTVTDIKYDVTGCARHKYIDSPVVQIVVSGTFQGHKLNGMCLINFENSQWRDPVETHGAGRSKSFLVGGLSLHKSHPAYAVIIRDALSLAKLWVKDNPGALYEFKLTQAKQKLELASDIELAATTSLQLAQTAWLKASNELDALEAKGGQ